jgi:hypothetical protein
MNKEEYEEWYDKGEGSEHMKQQILKDAREHPINYSDTLAEEFYCNECGHFLPISELGKSEKNGKPYKACKKCCHEEQMKQFYTEM